MERIGRWRKRGWFVTTSDAVKVETYFERAYGAVTHREFVTEGDMARRTNGE